MPAARRHAALRRPAAQPARLRVASIPGISCRRRRGRVGGGGGAGAAGLEVVALRELYEVGVVDRLPERAQLAFARAGQSDGRMMV